jgi:hypothetical protein
MARIVRSLSLQITEFKFGGFAHAFRGPRRFPRQLNLDRAHALDRAEESALSMLAEIGA